VIDTLTPEPVTTPDGSENDGGSPPASFAMNAISSLSSSVASGSAPVKVPLSA